MGRHQLLKSIQTAFLFITILLLLSCASGHRKQFTKRLKPFRNIESVEQRIKDAVTNSIHLSIQEIGRVTYKEFQEPVWLICFRCNENSKLPILLTGSIHGNEAAGAEYIVNFVEALSQHPERYPDQSFHMVPIINPWGWIHDTRFNQNGYDINRDFVSFSSQESRIIMNHTKKKRYSLMLDLHEDPSAKGFYLYQHGQKNKTISEMVTNGIRQMGYPLEEDTRKVILKSEDGIIDIPIWGLWYMRLTYQLNIANYYRLNNSDHVFTIETPTDVDIQDRVRMQEKAVAILIRHFSNKKQN